ESHNLINEVLQQAVVFPVGETRLWMPEDPFALASVRKRREQSTQQRKGRLGLALRHQPLNQGNRFPRKQIVDVVTRLYPLRLEERDLTRNLRRHFEC